MSVDGSFQNIKEYDILIPSLQNNAQSTEKESISLTYRHYAELTVILWRLFEGIVHIYQGMSYPMRSM